MEAWKLKVVSGTVKKKKETGSIFQFMVDKKMSVGIAFSGGGGKGAYEIGVWKALEEYGLAKHIDYVSGTSVGSLNAALFMQGDYKNAEEAWLGIKPSDILYFDPLKIIITLIKLGFPKSRKLQALSYLKSGFLSRKGLTRIIEEHFDQTLIDYSNKNLFLSCTELGSSGIKFKNKMFDCKSLSDEQVKKILLASSAIPVVFGAEDIDGKSYIDGYFTDNTPVKPLYDAGARIIIVVFLGRMGGLFDDAYVERKDYPGANIINIVPQKDLGGLLSGVLNFNNIQEKIDLGYRDAVRIFEHHKSILNSQLRVAGSMQKLMRSAKNCYKPKEIVPINNAVIKNGTDFSNEFKKKLEEW